MLGAIAGDIIGSTHERRRVTTRRFALFPYGSKFTDDTVLTAAVASALIDARRSSDGTAPDYHSAVLAFARKWPHAGYGGNFHNRINSPDPRPYNSWGNGSAMRVSPVGFAFDDGATVLREAECSVRRGQPVAKRCGWHATQCRMFPADWRLTTDCLDSPVLLPRMLMM